MRKDSLGIYMDDIATAIYLHEVLKKLGVKRDCLVSDYNFDYFSESELDKIKTLFITGLDSIQFLRYLPNLEKLQIISDDYTNVEQAWGQMRDVLQKKLNEYNA